jgi:CDP-4-dehydro-6-deoxyglucose reductase, E1
MMKHIFVGDFKISDDERIAINAVLDAGRISEWRKVREFEQVFAKYIGSRYCLAVSSGTAALLVGILALIYDERYPRVKPGGKVITSPVTYIATSNAIKLSGLEPVYVDIDPQTFAVRPDLVEEHLSKASNPEEYCMILPVHLMGYPCDMDEINRIAKKYGLVTLEDSAQAHGSLYKGKRTGSLSLLSDFSFYIAHNIQAGEMGAVVTDDEKLYLMMRKLKANGRMCECLVCTRSEGRCPVLNTQESDEDDDPRFLHEWIGYNFKTMEFQAALGVSQVKKAELIFEKRFENVKYLNSRLSKFSDELQLPYLSDQVSYLAYPMVIKNSSRINRKRLRQKLESFGVETRPLFGCIPTQQPAFDYLKHVYEGKLSNAEYVGKNGFYIGCHQYLTRDDLEYIVQVFENIMEGLS